MTNRLTTELSWQLPLLQISCLLGSEELMILDSSAYGAMLMYIHAQSRQSSSLLLIRIKIFTVGGVARHYLSHYPSYHLYWTMAAEETVASLCGRNPADLKVAELKLWPQEWKKSTRGKVWPINKSDAKIRRVFSLNTSFSVLTLSTYFCPLLWLLSLVVMWTFGLCS